MSVPNETSPQIEPVVFVIFGGGGDLAWRKLIPSLYYLHLEHSLPERFAIIGVDRAAYGDRSLRARWHDGVSRFAELGKVKKRDWEEFAGHISYLRGDFATAKTYSALAERLDRLDREWKAKPVRIFHLAVPPSLVAIIPRYLANAGLARDRARARVVVEKPIGTDLASAQRLNLTLVRSFQERQIFRIDHYLGKETVQNILALRFGNPMFEPVWNRRFVEYVTITVAEDLGIGHRGGYYDHAGELRDMVQNHAMQLLCLVAMEAPVSFSADEIRNKKVDVLHALRPLTPEELPTAVVRGQYGPGRIHGKRVPGYRQEGDVAPDSQTETYAAVRFFVDNLRWQDVPFYIRAGKRMPRQRTEIILHFRPVPHRSFPPEAVPEYQPTRVIIRIQPEEGIRLQFYAKQPGAVMRLRLVEMRFDYRGAFKIPSPPPYATLLRDVMMGDATLFMRDDQVEAAWAALMPVLNAWSHAPAGDFPNYPAGTWGPPAADALLAHHGQSWSAAALGT